MARPQPSPGDFSDLDLAAFLRGLGKRVRVARERRGWTVLELAEASGVSRRHITESEAGRANLSVAKLFALARALGVAPGELVDVATRAPERLALVGLRGAGKSTLGRRLALELETPLVELDKRIEELAGMSIGAVFELHGSLGFRRLEAEALEQVLAEGERVVIAAGGSIVSAPETFERLLATCRTVWLSASAEDHYSRVMAQGDERPMRGRPRAMDELRRLLTEREPQYRRCAIHVDTSKSDLDACVRTILAQLAG
jgi:XRE family aerobic/anaerobic benzoate catabolism transcriptional regulator